MRRRSRVDGLAPLGADGAGGGADEKPEAGADADGPSPFRGEADALRDEIAACKAGLVALGRERSEAPRLWGQREGELRERLHAARRRLTEIEAASGG